jgi:hypothetical protein
MKKGQEMNKTIANFANPRHKKPVTDGSGHYDIDGVTQDQDFDVIIAGDKTPSNNTEKNLSSLRERFKKWLSAWDDELYH